MPRSTASRKYQLTINNPKEHGFDHAAIKSALVGLSGCVYCACVTRLGNMALLIHMCM